MSGREWKSGDVALIRTQGGDHEVLGLRDTHGWAHLKDWRSPHGSHSIWTSASQVTAVRPLLVIDPEDREQVERLISGVRRARVLQDRDTQMADDGFDRALTAALREFANPTPPRPDEPMGLGAVVESARGNLYVRAGDGWLPSTVLGMFRNPIDWNDIAAVKVLSEGVQP